MGMIKKKKHNYINNLYNVSITGKIVENECIYVHVGIVSFGFFNVVHKLAFFESSFALTLLKIGYTYYP